MARSNLVTYAFLWEKVKTVDFSETIEACDLKVGRCRQLIEIMKLCEYLRSRSFVYHIFSRFCMFCALLTSRYQVSVYRTNGPLVTHCLRKRHIPFFPKYCHKYN